MNSTEYFQKLGICNSRIERADQTRISQTISLIPHEWNKIIDIGCGDGRVSNNLIPQGFNITGIDLADKRLKHFAGNAVVANICHPWPFFDRFDGAICSEVIEHLTNDEIVKVVDNIKQKVRYGFVITVPAKEPFEYNFVTCPSCHNKYHIFGHVQKFHTFDDLDKAIGMTSRARIFIPYEKKSPSLLLGRLKQDLGAYPFSDFSRCPYCGFELMQKPIRGIFRKLGVKALAGLEKLTDIIREEYGWFACRYDLYD